LVGIARRRAAFEKIKKQKPKRKHVSAPSKIEKNRVLQNQRKLVVEC
jgi:hypothetical protein